MDAIHCNLFFDTNAHINSIKMNKNNTRTSQGHRHVQTIYLTIHDPIGIRTTRKMEIKKALNFIIGKCQRHSRSMNAMEKCLEPFFVCLFGVCGVTRRVFDNLCRHLYTIYQSFTSFSKCIWVCLFVCSEWIFAQTENCVKLRVRISSATGVCGPFFFFFLRIANCDCRETSRERLPRESTPYTHTYKFIEFLKKDLSPSHRVSFAATWNSLRK